MSTGVDLGRLAEAASESATLTEYEREALAVIAPRVGFDVAMFKRASGLGPHAPGLDPAIRRACEPHFATFAAEMADVVAAALGQRGVAVDVDVLGMRRMERLSYYQRLMRPHGGQSTAMVYLRRRERVIGALALGRTRGSFEDRELAYLRAIAPTLAVCEVVVNAEPAPARSAPPGAALLTARERDVLAYLPLGYTNAQIACALGSAERTVRNQLSSVYAKLGVGSRAEATAVALELGLG